MNAFHNLPNEILLDITRLLCRKDTLAWILSSRPAYQCGSATLYDRIDMSYYSGDQVARLAHTLTLRPCLALLVRCLILPDFPGLWVARINRRFSFNVIPLPAKSSRKMLRISSKNA